MSDAWDEIQAIKSKRNSLREKLEKRKKERQDIFGSTTLLGVTQNIIVNNGSVVKIDSSIDDSTILTLKLEIDSDSDIEKIILQLLSNSAILLPINSVQLTTRIEKLLERCISRESVHYVLKRLALQSIVSIKNVTIRGETGVELIFVDHNAVLNLYKDFMIDNTFARIENEFKRKHESEEEDDENSHKFFKCEKRIINCKETSNDDAPDIMSLLSMPSTREKQSKQVGEEILELLTKPTAKERSLAEKFKSHGGAQVMEFCPHGTRVECLRAQQTTAEMQSNSNGGNNRKLNTIIINNDNDKIDYDDDNNIDNDNDDNNCNNKDQNQNLEKLDSNNIDNNNYDIIDTDGVNDNDDDINNYGEIITEDTSNNIIIEKIDDTEDDYDSKDKNTIINENSNNSGRIVMDKCRKLHFKKIIQSHTDESLGDCSFLNTCFHMTTCKYVHYEVDICSSSNNNSRHEDIKGYSNTISKRTSDPSATLYPPQWIQCDLRYLDMTVLGKFAVVMADPPWDIHMELPYGTMSDDEMRQLGVPALQDDGLIFLWVTGRAMELGRECLKLWGYERVDELIWVKTNQLQRIIRTGRTGHWLNHGKEHCLVGMKGDPKNLNRGLDCDVIVAEVRATSHKPDEIYGIIERLSPGTRKIELFGRPHNVQPNWITLGNQLDGIRLVDPELIAQFQKRYPDGNCMAPTSTTKK